MTPLRAPLVAWLMAAAGLACMAFGVLLLAGVGRAWHPLLAADGAGVVVLVSGIALAGSAAFPLAFARLAARDDPQ